MMNKLKVTTVLIVFLGLSYMSAMAQTILSIDNLNISKQDFENIYKKNNKNENPTQADLDEYMELFINYKLKVIEAEELRMDTIPSFKKELNGYRNQLAAPYLIDKNKTGALIDEAYERLKTEVRASHILIGFGKGTSPNDTLDAYNRIREIRKQIVDGEKTFEEMAIQHSTDPSAKQNKGDLGYFKSLQMVYPFETAAFTTPVGQISKPVRTRFGYHILKVVDKRPTLGEVQASHILILVGEKFSEKEKKVAKERIFEIYKELKDGKDFELLAKKYSDDKSSAKNGGNLGRFGSGKMVKAFEDNVFALKNDGDISEPFQTRFGWHIVKRIQHFPLASREEMEKELKSKISKDSRAEITRNSFIKQLKKEYKFKEKKKALKKIYQVVDSTLFAGRFTPGDHGLKKMLFKIEKRKYTQAHFIKYLQRTQGRTDKIDMESLIERKYKSYVDASMINYEKGKLEEKYPKFKSLYKEYRDGILLFNLTENKIWGKAAKDSLGLVEYYDTHKEEFTYDTRVKATMVKCVSLTTAEQVRKLMEEGKTSKEINELFNKESKLNVILESGIFEYGDEEIFSEVPFVVGLSDIKEINGQFWFANIKEVMEKGVRPFEESKGLVTAAYQKYLEEEWIKELRSKHNVVIHKEVLYSVK